MNVAFLFGGPGDERDVSLATAKRAMPSFPDGYQIKPVYITHDRQWVPAESYVVADRAWANATPLMAKSGIPAEIALDELERERPDVVFIGLHGEYGEDGTVQALLEARGLTFAGSQSAASALALDKPKIFQLLQDEAITVPEHLEVTAAVLDGDVEDFVRFHGLPVFILPATSGSSVGVKKITDQTQLMPGLTAARDRYDRLVVSKAIEGREVSCGTLVVGSDELVALPPTELVPSPNHQFFDYDDKYVAGETREITPAPMASDVLKRIQALALRVHKLIGADGYARVDMIVSDDGHITVLEINTLPGLVATSILPQQAAAQGIPYGELLATICVNAKPAPEYLTA